VEVTVTAVLTAGDVVLAGADQGVGRCLEPARPTPRSGGDGPIPNQGQDLNPARARAGVGARARVGAGMRVGAGIGGRGVRRGVGVNPRSHPGAY